MRDEYLGSGWLQGYAGRPNGSEAAAEALDEIFAEDINPQWNLDAVESKLFGLGSEAYVVGSHEFYMGYGIRNNKLICLDAGHFHPTESIAGKLSSLALFTDGLLLHVSRPMRWDSDHVVIMDDELTEIGRELVRNNLLDVTHIGLDFLMPALTASPRGLSVPEIR